MRHTVKFIYLTGLVSSVFKSAELIGSWDSNGHYSREWSKIPMIEARGSDGCQAFTAVVVLARTNAGQEFQWGVELDGRWAIMTEVNSTKSSQRHRSFVLMPVMDGSRQEQMYCLNHSRRMGSHKHYRTSQDKKTKPNICFRLWAPNARAVDVCMATLWEKGHQLPCSSLVDHKVKGRRAMRSIDRSLILGGYISDAQVHPERSGIHPAWGPFPMFREPGGFWATDPEEAELSDFLLFDHAPYMYRITKDDGDIVYRTDLYSRCQIGYGKVKPSDYYDGPTRHLDGTVSCSVVVDQDLVATDFTERVWPETKWTDQAEFFETSAYNTPARLRDLIIYELHVGALGANTRADDEPGTLEDVIQFLGHLQDLGVNAVELLPLSEFGGGGGGWGYATSHYHAIEYSGGGRDQYKHFIRECHRRGIAVILDVVYNHYSHDANRAQWMYDTNAHDKNAYYWYEGRPNDYADFDDAVEPQRKGQGGYLDNGSSGWAPRYWEEPVRNLFISSAITLAVEFQVDGVRVDQTTSIRSYNRRHSDGHPVREANIFGSKLLRELTRSLRFVKPDIILIAEDHENWDGVHQDADHGGLGFDAVWYADFYHHLIGDTDKGPEYAKLLKTAGFGDDRPLAMDRFAGALQATAGGNKIVYHESHDEAGNGEGTDRTVRVAVNGAPLVGDTRRYAEARCRFAAGMSMLSAGIPLFLFGEEVGAQNKFLYDRVLEYRENLEDLRNGSGRYLFAFYRALITLRRSNSAICGPNIEVIFSDNVDRLIGFHRWDSTQQFLVFASLNNSAFDRPSYTFRSELIPQGNWQEVFNSDAHPFGGLGIGNGGNTVSSAGGILECVLPANGFVVYAKV